MAMYTMELRVIIEHYSQYDSNLSLDEKIEIGRKKLFDFEYPFFSENYRPQFERNIINEFYMREIGYETEGLFKMRLRHWLNVNMPYYNKLFESELIKYDPLTNSRMNVTHTKLNDKQQTDDRNTNLQTNTHGTGKSDSNQKGDFSSTGNSTSKANTNDEGFNRKVESDTPQTRLRLSTGDDGTGVIEYASKITENKDKNKSSSDSTGTSSVRNDESINVNSTDETNLDTKGKQDETLNSEVNEMEKFVQERVGKVGVQTYGKLIQDYRDTLLRVEVQIHKEMQQLFMLVY